MSNPTIQSSAKEGKKKRKDRSETVEEIIKKKKKRRDKHRDREVERAHVDALYPHANDNKGETSDKGGKAKQIRDGESGDVASNYSVSHSGSSKQREDAEAETNRETNSGVSGVDKGKEKEKKKKKKKEKKLHGEQSNQMKETFKTPETLEKERLMRKKERKMARREERREEQAKANATLSQRPEEHNVNISSAEKSQDYTPVQKDNEKRKEVPLNSQDTYTRPDLSSSNADGIHSSESSKKRRKNKQGETSEIVGMEKEKEKENDPVGPARKKKKQMEAIQGPGSEMRAMPMPFPSSSTEKKTKTNHNQHPERDSSVATNLRAEKGFAPRSQSPSTNATTSTTPVSKTGKSGVQSLIDRALKKMVRGAGRRDTSSRSPRESKSSPTNTKNGTLEDAAGLTHEEMLVERLYHSDQLKWLAEERGLQVKKGRFSNWEQNQMDAVITAFKGEQDMSDDDFVDWMFGNSSKEESEKGKLYNEFWQRVTRSITNRPNRAVRIYIRRMYQPKVSEGPWSDEEHANLEKSVKKMGQSWLMVSRAVGTRTPEACRLQWRDGRQEVKENKILGHFSAEEVEKLKQAVMSICKEDDIDPKAEDAKISWKRVSEKLGRTRNPNQCMLKWRSIVNGAIDSDMEEEPSPRKKWNREDDKIFAKLLSQQQSALEKDDFKEVPLSDLKTPEWPKDKNLLQKHWRSLVKFYVSKDADPKANFRENLKCIQEALDSGRKRIRKSRSTRTTTDLSDMIDSEEEGIMTEGPVRDDDEEE